MILWLSHCHQRYENGKSNSREWVFSGFGTWYYNLFSRFRKIKCMNFYNSSLLEFLPPVQEVVCSNPGRDMSVSGILIQRRPLSSLSMHSVFLYCQKRLNSERNLSPQYIEVSKSHKFCRIHHLVTSTGLILSYECFGTNNIRLRIVECIEAYLKWPHVIFYICNCKHYFCSSRERKLPGSQCSRCLDVVDPQIYSIPGQNKNNFQGWWKEKWVGFKGVQRWSGWFTFLK